MRVVILGLDGMDYHLVNKFNLEVVKQKEYRKTDISEFIMASSPVLWGSFLTGKNLEQEKYILGLKRRIWEFSREFQGKVPKSIIPFFDKMGELINIFNFRVNVKEENTIFDLTENSDYLPIPGHSKSIAEDELIGKVISNKISRTRFKRLTLKHFKEFKQKFLDKLKQRNDLLMAHCEYPDKMGHIFRGDLEEMKRTYKGASSLVRKAKKVIDQNTLFLIISDHGMKELGGYGDHMIIEYGFYSSNRELRLKNPKLTDFYKIIEKKLKEE